MVGAGARTILNPNRLIGYEENNVWSICNQSKELREDTHVIDASSQKHISTASLSISVQKELDSFMHFLCEAFVVFLKIILYKTNGAKIKL